MIILVIPAFHSRTTHYSIFPDRVLLHKVLLDLVIFYVYE